MKLSHIAIAVTGFLCGTLAASFLKVDIPFALFSLLIALLFLVEMKFFVANESAKAFYVYLSIFFVFSSLAIFRYDLRDDKAELAYSDFGFVKAVGVIADEPVRKDNSTTFRVLVEKVFRTDGEVISDKAMNVLIASRRIYQDFSYGDRIEILGKLDRVKNFLPDFDYEAYLAKDEIYYQFRDPKMVLVSRGQGSWVREKLYSIKNSFLENLNKVIPEPESALLGGIVVGAKSSLGEEILDEWRKVGLIQVVVLSGYNISVVADAVAQVLAFLPMGLRIGFGSLAIVLFSMMTGGGATVVRAAIMALLALLARATGKLYVSGTALLVGGLLIVLYNPKTLVFDTSFQLSFLATAGLIFLSPIIEKFLFGLFDDSSNKIFSSFINILSATIAAQLAVFPLIAYKMGMISLVAIPANILVSPLVPLTMFLGFLIGLFGFISYLLSLPFAYFAYILLAYDLKVAHLFAILPFSSLDISFPVWLTVSIYLVYVFIGIKYTDSAR